jgi:hypothetical protein
VSWQARLAEACAAHSWHSFGTAAEIPSRAKSRCLLRPWNGDGGDAGGSTLTAEAAASHSAFLLQLQHAPVRSPPWSWSMRA